jgi:asparagine synthase (glutamine-hydrolysing)
MCGILGVIGNQVDLENVDRAMGSQFCRGPDSFGVFQEPGMLFGHRRLAIMDVSVHSAQPMQFEDLVMVFNGAVYNYREIRRELEQKGYSFYSDGDTEVILKGYHYWGREVLKKFNGMFAFAVWDRTTKVLFAARDRLGIKPFYYSLDNGTFKFASTTQSLLKLGVSDTSLNPVALNHYFTFHTVVPAPHTMVNGIKKLPQACTLEFHADSGELKLHDPYWRIPTPTASGGSYEDCRDLLAEKLELAVKHRMTAAVDVGVLLSGGLDSSLITALANQHHPDLHTFSIGFESTEEEKGDEFEYSDVIVNHFQTTHTQIPIEKGRMLSALPQAVAAMSEPMGSHDAIGFYLLSQEVSRSIKVVQSGQGADEVFAGYHWYPKIAGSSQSAADAYEQAFFDRDEADLNGLLSRDYQVPGNPGREFLDSWFDALGDTAAVDKALHIDSGVMLVDDPVKRVDNMTMAWGLEARVPFLDHELVEAAFTIPAEFKYEDGGKKILKDVARKYIPSDVIDRPKGYFPVPALKYIRGDYLEMIRSAVDSQRARERGIVSRKRLNDMLRAPDDCITRLRGNTLWQYAVLEMWLQSQDL